MAVPRCGNPDHVRDYNDGFGHRYCRQCYLIMHRQKAQRQRTKLKNQVFTHYGGKCVCCGESNWMFLTIDHVNGSGAAHRLELTGRPRQGGSTQMYRWLVKNNYPDGFQLLCWNCNVTKHIYGMCPHQMGGDANALSVQSVHGSPL